MLGQKKREVWWRCYGLHLSRNRGKMTDVVVEAEQKGEREDMCEDMCKKKSQKKLDIT